MSTKKAMIAWINTVIPEYGITNFNTNWNDGRALCGTVDKIRPGACPNHQALDPRTGLDNCRLGMDLAERLLSIPKIVSPEDLNSRDVDDLSVMTYMSYFCDPANLILLKWIRKKIPDRNIKNLSTDWNNGINLGALVEACFPGVCPEWKDMEPTNAIDNLKKLITLIKERLGLDCPVSAAELANPAVDEIVVATYLSQFRNAKLRASPEEFSLRVPSLPKGSAIIREPVNFGIDVNEKASDLAKEIKVTAHGPSSDIGVNLTPKGDGALGASFIPTEAGSYEIFAAYQGEHISGSPFSLPVADPSKCQIFGDIPRQLQVGEPEEMSVKTRGAGIGQLTCTFDETGQASTPKIQSEVSEQENEQWTVKLLPKGIGETLIEPKWAGEYVPQAPIKASICDASQCKVSGEDLTSGSGRVGDPIKFKLTAKKERAGVAKPEIKPRGPSANYSPEITDNQDGTYDVSFTPWEVGPHKVDVSYGGAHVPRSPFSLNISAAPDANTCSATGKGLKKAISGRPNDFTILAPEKDLLEKKNGLSVEIGSRHTKVPVEITDNKSGSYKVNYTGPTPGAYVIEVKYFEKQIPGSPFKLDVVPAPNASKCRAYGPALHPNSLHISGTPLDMYVDTTKAGNGELQVVVKGPEAIKPKVFTANDKGTYSLKFDVPEAGRYLVHVWWSQEHIPGSPFKLKVHPAPNAGMVKAYGPGLEPSFESGEPGNFTVETKNAGIGTLTVRVHGVKGKFKIEADPKSESDPRTLLAHYNPQEAGDYIIAVRWSGNHVPGSPFNINIRNSKKEKEREKKEKERGKKKKEVEEIEETDGGGVAGAEAAGPPRLSNGQFQIYQQQQQYQQKKMLQGGKGKKGITPPPGVLVYAVPQGPHQQQRSRTKSNPLVPVGGAGGGGGGGGEHLQSQSHVVVSKSTRQVKASSLKTASQVRIQEEPSTIYIEKEEKKVRRKKKF